MRKNSPRVSFLHTQALDRIRNYLQEDKIYGDIFRTKAVYKSTDKAIYIETPAITTTYHIYSRDKSASVEDVRKKDKTILILRGDVLATNFVESNKLDFIVANDNESALKILKNSRVDYFIAASQYYKFVLDEKLEDKIFMIQDPLLFTYVYLIVHEKHEKWIEQINKAIRTLYKNGVHKEIFSQIRFFYYDPINIPNKKKELYL